MVDGGLLEFGVSLGDLYRCMDPLLKLGPIRAAYDSSFEDYVRHFVFVAYILYCAWVVPVVGVLKALGPGGNDLDFVVEWMHLSPDTDSALASRLDEYASRFEA